MNEISWPALLTDHTLTTYLGSNKPDGLFEKTLPEEEPYGTGGWKDGLW